MAAKSSVTPYLVVQDVEQLITFLKEVFGAKEIRRELAQDNTIMHVDVLIGQSVIVIVQATEALPPRLGSSLMGVEDAELVYNRAIHAGATAIMPPARVNGGWRAGVSDPAGNAWWISSQVGRASVIRGLVFAAALLGAFFLSIGVQHWAGPNWPAEELTSWYPPDYTVYFFPLVVLLTIASLLVDRMKNGALLDSVGYRAEGIFAALTSESVVQGLVYFGAALLIIVVGLRGARLLPIEKPTYIVLALSLESSLLVLLSYVMLVLSRARKLGEWLNTA
jgi:PhnB protein